MPIRDYYLILGISPKESQTGVRSAWRDLARKYHPDRAGQQATRRFQEVSEAYNVLGDPQRRAEYDRSRNRPTGEPQRRPSGGRAGFSVEPLDPGPARASARRAPSGGIGPLSIMDDFIAPHPVFDDVFDRFRRNFTEEWMPKSGRQDVLHLGLVLSSEEARRGGTVALGVPISFPCPACQGTGHSGFFYSCSTCRETGLIEIEEHVHLRIPPGIRDGALFEIPLQGKGIQNVFLRLMIRVAD